MRTITKALLYILRSGQPWRMLPGDFPPVTTVQRYFYAWRDIELWTTINHLLLMDCREALGREASPSAGVIDSESVKSTESGGPCGYDAGKKTKGRKRWARRLASVQKWRLRPGFTASTPSAMVKWLYQDLAAP